MTNEAPREIKRIAPGSDLGFFLRVGSQNGEVEHAARACRGEQRHLRLELEMMAHREPWPEPGTANKAKSALAVADATAAEE